MSHKGVSATNIINFVALTPLCDMQGRSGVEERKEALWQ